MSAFELQIEHESELLNEIFEHYTPKHIYNLGFLRPTEGRTSGVFGARRYINGVPKSSHKGYDIAAPLGSLVQAPLKGKVVLTHSMYFTGNTVVVDHGQGMHTIYAHLDGIEVIEGEELSRGDIIGTVGKTGRATGPHLHFGLNLNASRVNPALFFKDAIDDDENAKSEDEFFEESEKD